MSQFLEKYKNNCRELTAIIWKQEKQIQFLETKALHLSMFYVAIQLLIFMFNSKTPSSSYQCRNWWKSFALSSSVAVLYCLNFSVTIVKYMRIRYEQDRNYLDQGENYYQMSYLERNGNRLNNQDANGDSYPPSTNLIAAADDRTILKYSKQQKHEPDAFAVYQRYAHVGLTVSILLAYTILVLHTCRSSPCAAVS